MSKPVLSDIDLTKMRQAGGHAEPPPPTVEHLASHHRPGRSRRTHLTVFIFPSVKKQLRLLGIDRNLTIQAQVIEALNDYFAKHGKPETAE